MDPLLDRYSGRLPDTVISRCADGVLLLSGAEGVPIDIALAAIPFEGRVIERSSLWAVSSDSSLRTCSAEDLVVLKIVAGRTGDCGRHRRDRGPPGSATRRCAALARARSFAGAEGRFRIGRQAPKADFGRLKSDRRMPIRGAHLARASGADARRLKTGRSIHAGLASTPSTASKQVETVRRLPTSGDAPRGARRVSRLGALGLALLVVNLALLPRCRASPASRAARRRSSRSSIPARNEERDVEATVRGHLTCAGVPEPRGRRRRGPVDATRRAAILERLAREDPRLRGRRRARAAARLARKAARAVAGRRRGDGRAPPLRRRRRALRPARACREAVASRSRRSGSTSSCLLPRIETRGFWENVLMPYLRRARSSRRRRFWRTGGRPRWIAAGGGAGNLIRRVGLRGRRRARRAAGLGGRRRAPGLPRSKRPGFARRRRSARRTASRCGCTADFAEVFDGFTKNIAYALPGLRRARALRR